MKVRIYLNAFLSNYLRAPLRSFHPARSDPSPIQSPHPRPKRLFHTELPASKWTFFGRRRHPQSRPSPRLQSHHAPPRPCPRLQSHHPQPPHPRLLSRTLPYLIYIYKKVSFASVYTFLTAAVSSAINRSVLLLGASAFFSSTSFP